MRRLNWNPASGQGTRRAAGLTLWILVCLTLLPLPPRLAQAQTGIACDSTACNSETLQQFSLDPYRFFNEMRDGDIRKCAPCVLGNSRFTATQERDAMIVLAEVYLASARPDVARAACLGALRRNPCTSIDPALPLPLRRLFYSTQDSLLASMKLLCEADFKTIAVGDIENNSQDAMDLDMDKLCRGLQKVLMNDLARATCLQVVDRDRLDTLIKERNLQPQSAAKLVGAQTYMFGSLLQVDKKEFVLTLRLDHTETTEVLVSEQIQQKIRSGKDFLALEKKVLLDYLVPQIQAMCQATNTNEIRDRMERYFAEAAEQVPEYEAYVLKVGEAMLADEAKDTKASRAAWAAAAQLNPFDTDASRRRDMLDSFAKLQTQVDVGGR